MAKQEKSQTERKPRTKINRGEHSFAVWIGKSNTPKFWAKTQDEVTNFLGGMKPSKLQDVTVGKLNPVKVSVNIQVGSE